MVSKLDCYLKLDIEDVENPITWWYEHCTLYPNLLRMALDYLTIPRAYIACSFIRSTLILPQSHLATSIDVECFFSHGQLLLSHVRSRLSARTTAAILCLGHWSHLNLIKNEDILKVTSLPDLVSDENIIILNWYFQTISLLLFLKSSYNNTCEFAFVARYNPCGCRCGCWCGYGWGSACPVPMSKPIPWVRVWVRHGVWVWVCPWIPRGIPKPIPRNQGLCCWSQMCHSGIGMRSTCGYQNDSSLTLITESIVRQKAL